MGQPQIEVARGVPDNALQQLPIMDEVASKQAPANPAGDIWSNPPIAGQVQGQIDNPVGMLSRVTEVAEGEGIIIDWDNAVAVNTLTAHRLMWLAEHEYDSVRQLKGSMSQASCPDPAAFERASYMRALTTYAPSSVWEER